MDGFFGRIKTLQFGARCGFLVAVVVLAIASVDYAPARGQEVQFQPNAPEPPAPRTEFDLPETHPEGAIARQLVRWMRGRPRWRARIRNSTWRVEPEHVWSVRAASDCQAALEAAQIPFRSWRAAPRMATPVRVDAPVHGVNFHMPGPLVPIYLSCEMASRFGAIADVVRALGVTDVYLSSVFRTDPATSFHAVGLAIDIPHFRHENGLLSVEDHFEITSGVETCAASPHQNWRAETLRRIACDLYDTRLFSSVLTPNYNAGHRNHFHLDIRPDDPRQYLR